MLIGELFANLFFLEVELSFEVMPMGFQIGLRVSLQSFQDLRSLCVKHSPLPLHPVRKLSLHFALGIPLQAGDVLVALSELGLERLDFGRAGAAAATARGGTLLQFHRRRELCALGRLQSELLLHRVEVLRLSLHLGSRRLLRINIVGGLVEAGHVCEGFLRGLLELGSQSTIRRLELGPGRRHGLLDLVVLLSLEPPELGRLLRQPGPHLLDLSRRIRRRILALTGLAQLFLHLPDLQRHLLSNLVRSLLRLFDVRPQRCHLGLRRRELPPKLGLVVGGGGGLTLQLELFRAHVLSESLPFLSDLLLVLFQHLAEGLVSLQVELLLDLFAVSRQLHLVLVFHLKHLLIELLLALLRLLLQPVCHLQLQARALLLLQPRPLLNHPRCDIPLHPLCFLRLPTLARFAVVGLELPGAMKTSRLTQP
mmetsp:Transcript_60820/g.199141  ORF Transcript_60820/g.199141 Transcript_60820/m.199141 type:complete len:424 (-) Transcript_60820:251-1522(-)